MSMRGTALIVALIALSAGGATAWAQVGKVAEEDMATSTTPAMVREGHVAEPEEIPALQDAYHERFGRYLQILPDSRSVQYPSASLADTFGAQVRSDIQVDVYESPRGSGYQISYDHLGTRYTVGYGPEAKERTYSRPLNFEVASSTGR